MSVWKVNLKQRMIYFLLLFLSPWTDFFTGLVLYLDPFTSHELPESLLDKLWPDLITAPSLLFPPHSLWQTSHSFLSTLAFVFQLVQKSEIYRIYNKSSAERFFPHELWVFEASSLIMGLITAWIICVSCSCTTLFPFTNDELNRFGYCFIIKILHSFICDWCSFMMLIVLLFPLTPSQKHTVVLPFRITLLLKRQLFHWILPDRYWSEVPGYTCKTTSVKV